MQRIKLIFPFLSVCCTLTLLMSGCAKERIKNDEINGSVQHLTDGDFLADVPVVLVEEYIPPEPFAAIERTILQSVVTDELGQFKFEPLRSVKRNRSYFIEIPEREYLATNGWGLGDYETVNSVVRLTNEETTSLELTTVTFGFVNLKIFNHSEAEIEVIGIVDNGQYHGKQFGLKIDPQSTQTQLGKNLMSGTYAVTWQFLVDSEAVELVQTLDVPMNDTVQWTVYCP